MKWQLSLDEILKATSGKKLSSTESVSLGVGTDSRQDLTGLLFIALKGDVFDGHDFVTKAVAQGASIVLVHEWRDEWAPLLGRASFVQVTDTLLGLQSLGNFWRRKHRFIVVGISGSNGKTTSKEYAAALISPVMSCYASRGSFNNHWGVPLSILQAGPQHKVLILEMGMNHLGELATLCRIAEPDVVAVTMVGQAHIGEVGSQELVAQAKEEMYVACPGAIQIFNLENPWTRAMCERARALGKAKRIITFSSDASSDIQLSVESMTESGLHINGRIGRDGKPGRREGTINVFGRHNVVNLMVAASVGLSVDLAPEKIWQGLIGLSDVSWGRNQIVPLSNGAKVLFDAYNANPDSMAALTANLSEMSVAGRKFLVLGDMLELGAIAKTAHRQLGDAVGKMGVAGVLYQGEFAEDFAQGLGARAPLMSSREFDGPLALKFAALFHGGDLIAMKGSRGMKLERILKAWNPPAFAEKS